MYSHHKRSRMGILDSPRMQYSSSPDFDPEQRKKQQIQPGSKYGRSGEQIVALNLPQVVFGKESWSVAARRVAKQLAHFFESGQHMPTNGCKRCHFQAWFRIGLLMVVECPVRSQIFAEPMRNRGFTRLFHSTRHLRRMFTNSLPSSGATRPKL